MAGQLSLFTITDKNVICLCDDEEKKVINKDFRTNTTMYLSDEPFVPNNKILPLMNAILTGYDDVCKEVIDGGGAIWGDNLHKQDGPFITFGTTKQNSNIVKERTTISIGDLKVKTLGNLRAEFIRVVNSKYNIGLSEIHAKKQALRRNNG